MTNTTGRNVRGTGAVAGRRHRSGARKPELDSVAHPARPSTKALLMDATEFLISRYGVEGVTLRDIASLAGQSNNNVVQYHFGGKFELIEAILDDRIRCTEKLREERFEKLKQIGRENNPRDLLEIVWLSTLSLKGEVGDYTFGRFRLQCRLHPGFYSRYREKEHFEGSELVKIIKRLRDNYPHLSDQLFVDRLSALTLMFLMCAVEFEDNRDKDSDDKMFDHVPILDMAMGSFSSPQTNTEKI